MALSNLVALAIMLTAGATLHVAGKTDIDSSQMAAEALRPIDWLFGPTPELHHPLQDVAVTRYHFASRFG